MKKSLDLFALMGLIFTRNFTVKKEVLDKIILTNSVNLQRHNSNL